MRWHFDPKVVHLSHIMVVSLRSKWAAGKAP
jgi:hypothetical protein